MQALGPGAGLLPGFALRWETALVADLGAVAAEAPFRRMMTPGGKTMSAAMTSCGPLGWVTDRRGYRYEPCDPESGRPWPAMPVSFRELAEGAASAAGYAGFDPDSCLVNRYEPGARMSLHQDRDEEDFTQPIVSVSLGLPGVFLWGGAERSERPERIPVQHGDVVVWGGPTRLFFHGVMPVEEGVHPILGPFRYNLTFRCATR